MRTRKNKNLTVSKRSAHSPFSDLITNSQNTISSQASVISKHSYNFVGTQSLDRDYDFQFYQDIISEQTQQLRISPEQQKRIQSILQLARKGKINPGNAFQVPLQVADPQIGEGQNMRFWKFASELLCASMGIYDKRVEHVFLGANRMFDSLIRVGSSKSQSEQQPEVRQQKKKAELIRIDISELGDPSKVAGYEIASVNCQQSHKISIKNKVSQFAADPLFNKTLQAFDSDSLKSLFLNVFETGPDLQVCFFHQSKPEKNRNMDIESEPIATSQDYDNDNESTKTQQKDAFPRFIHAEFKKLNLIATTGTSFTQMSTFRQEMLKMGLKEEENYVRNATESFADLDLNVSQLNLTSQKIEESQQLSYNQPDFHEQITSFSLNFQSQTVQQVDSAPLQSSQQSLISQQCFYSYVRESNSLITPWQYQFNGLKLIRKKNLRKKGAKNKRKEQGQQKSKKNQVDIDFLSELKLSRKDVFSCKADSKQTRASKYEDRNLLPLSYEPQALAFSTKSWFRHQETELNPHPFKTQPNTHIHNSQNYQPQEPKVQFQQQIQMIEIQQAPTSYQKGIAPLNTMRNIRELKERVFEKVSLRKQIGVSQIDFGISPASMLVIILHLVNEHRLQIVDETDSEIVVRACR